MNIKKVTDTVELKLTDFMNQAKAEKDCITCLFSKEHRLVYYNPDEKTFYSINGDAAKELINKISLKK